MKTTLLAGACAALLLGACSQEQPAEKTPLEKAADLPPGTTIKGEDGSKIKKQADGDLKVKDAEGNKVKQDADDGTVKVKTE